MKPNKNIDRLFQEKLRDFEETPPNIVWENIEADLNGEKKRRIIPIWWRYAGVAVILLLLTFSAFKYLNNSTQLENSIVDIDKNKTPLIDNNNQQTKQTNVETIVSSSSSDVGVKNNISTIKEKDNFENKKLFKQSKSDTNEQNSIAKNRNENIVIEPDTNAPLELNNKNTQTNTGDLITKNNTDKTFEQHQFSLDKLSNKEGLQNSLEELANTNTIATVDSGLKSESNPTKKTKEKTATESVAFENIENLEDTLDNKFKLKEEELVDELGNRWSVATVVAPVFYNSFNTKGSPLDLQFENSPKEGSQSVSYGVKFGFKLNKKWTVQSGVTMINMGYSVGDVYINPSSELGAAARLTNVDYTPTGTILNVSTQNIVSSNQIETSITAPVRGSLNQEYGYIEVPLEIKYSLTNGRLGVHLVGGFSTLFLNNNEVFVETSEFTSDLGEARNLNNVDFSGNFGFDVDYSINKHLYINVSPMLKVYTNTFSDNYENSDNFKPYLFGVYTGLNYKF